MNTASVSHPRVHSIDVFRPAGRKSAAEYLREVATMLEAGGPPYHAAIERVGIELTSAADSVKAAVTITLYMEHER